MTSIHAWVATGAKQKLVRQEIDLGPLGADDVEVAVEHCGLCHSDLSMLNNDWAMTQFPAVLGHEVIGRVTAVGSAVGSSDGVAVAAGLGDSSEAVSGGDWAAVAEAVGAGEVAVAEAVGCGVAAGSAGAEGTSDALGEGATAITVSAYAGTGCGTPSTASASPHTNAPPCSFVKAPPEALETTWAGVYAIRETSAPVYAGPIAAGRSRTREPRSAEGATGALPGRTRTASCCLCRSPRHRSR